MKLAIMVIFEIFVLIFDALSAYANYIAGRYIWAMIMTFFVGFVLSGLICSVINYFKE